MTMESHLRKFVLTAHVVCSVGALGGVIGFLVLAIAGLTSENAQVARGAYVSMEPIAKLVVMPLILGSLATGLVQALGTTWGLFRHYWVLIKFLLTVFTASVLLLQMEGIGFIAREASKAIPGENLHGLKSSFIVHAVGGLLVLLATTILSIYKPRGMTKYGIRKLREPIRGQ
jgi:hypothetical protein